MIALCEKFMYVLVNNSEMNYLHVQSLLVYLATGTCTCVCTHTHV